MVFSNKLEDIVNGTTAALQNSLDDITRIRLEDIVNKTSAVILHDLPDLSEIRINNAISAVR